MLQPDTMRAQGARRLIEVAQAHGVDRQELMAAAGLTEERIADPDRHIPLRLVFSLWGEVAKRIPDPDLGLEVAEHGTVRAAGVLGYAIANSPTLGSALRRFARHSRLLNTALEVGIEETSRWWRLYSRRPPIRPGFRPFSDSVTAGVVRMARELTTPRFGNASEIDPLEVRMTYPEPEDTSRLRRICRCDVLFSQPRGSVTFRAGDMERPVIDADVRLGEYLEELTQIHEDRLPKTDTITLRVASLLRRDLSEGAPTVASVAAELAESTRTLQRRLHEEGTSFSAVLDSVRREIAELLIEDPTLNLNEIAYLQGYADPSAFYRAFERWHGCSPREYRQRRR